MPFFIMAVLVMMGQVRSPPQRSLGTLTSSITKAAPLPIGVINKAKRDHRAGSRRRGFGSSRCC